jgi:hypothetical protein
VIPTLLIAAILSAIRISMVFGLELGRGQGSFEAVAHVFMGGLAVAWWYQPRTVYRRYRAWNWQWWLFWLLCVVEVGSVIASKILG